jgi:hypothetical protein
VAPIDHDVQRVGACLLAITQSRVRLPREWLDWLLMAMAIPRVRDVPWGQCWLPWPNTSAEDLPGLRGGDSSEISLASIASVSWLCADLGG